MQQQCHLPSTQQSHAWSEHARSHLMSVLSSFCLALWSCCCSRERADGTCVAVSIVVYPQSYLLLHVPDSWVERPDSLLVVRSDVSNSVCWLTNRPVAVQCNAITWQCISTHCSCRQDWMHVSGVDGIAIMHIQSVVLDTHVISNWQGGHASSRAIVHAQQEMTFVAMVDNKHTFCHLFTSYEWHAV